MTVSFTGSFCFSHLKLPLPTPEARRKFGCVISPAFRAFVAISIRKKAFAISAALAESTSAEVSESIDGG